MKQSERFALMQWLSYFPNNKTYAEIMEMLRDFNHTWVHEDLSVWETVEDCTLEQVADFIDDTRKHFEGVTKGIDMTTNLDKYFNEFSFANVDKATDAFYQWESNLYPDSDTPFSETDRFIFMAGFLRAHVNLRDALSDMISLASDNRPNDNYAGDFDVRLNRANAILQSQGK